MIKINIGIPETDRKVIAEHLSRLLADSFTLYLKTHNFHWNVTGPTFQALHHMFEKQYRALWEDIDTIAERIRALGFFAPATFRQLESFASIEEPESIPKAEDMIHELVDGHETVIRTARATLPFVEKVSDEATLNLLTERMHYHEKTAWMLRSLLETGTNVEEQIVKSMAETQAAQPSAH